jgi:hypothetical protein
MPLASACFVDHRADRSNFSRDGFLNGSCNGTARHSFDGFAVDGLVQRSHQRLLIDCGTKTVLHGLLVDAATAGSAGSQRSAAAADKMIFDMTSPLRTLWSPGDPRLRRWVEAPGLTSIGSSDAVRHHEGSRQRGPVRMPEIAETFRQSSPVRRCVENAGGCWQSH